jgi:hypothetical protein
MVAMLPADLEFLAQTSLVEFCEMYSDGTIAEQYKHLSLSDIVRLSEELNTQQVSDGFVVEEEAGNERTVETFKWREKLPNSNNTNVPFVLLRGDENNDATVALSMELYSEELSELDNNEVLEVEVKDTNGDIKHDKFKLDLDYPKDEKLSRKCAGLAGSGSEFLCTYCSESRKTCKIPPYVGDAEVSLSNTLLKETAQYCQLNPSKKSQELLSKVAIGVKEKPMCSTELFKERPDCLHLDINVTTQLTTIAARLFYHGETGQPLKYEKTEADRREMESSAAKVGF